ncbi:MAG: tetratricopeptide repeat protein [Flavobacteriaceae bacterium]|nr:MAG: tetratricopeptide repeat protein [Flavobacteriaceae bacterium]
MPLTKFESMLKTNSIYFLDLAEFEEIILHYLDTGKHTLAKKAIKLGLEQHPNAIDLKLLEVEILIFDNQLEKAARLIKKIQEIDPNNEEAYIQKAILLSKKGAHKQAILSLKDALIYVDDKADIWSLLGMEYLYMDDFKNARLNFEKCLDADFEDYAALYNIVYCFDMEKSHKQAIHYLNSYVDKNPYCEVAWHQLGCQYFMLKMFKEALTSFDFAVLIDEYFIGGYLEKAKTLEQLGCYNEAIENYLITLELDDPTVFAYMRVGECYDKLGTSDKAVNYYKKAVHEDPLLDKGWMLLAQSYFVNKDYQKSLYYVNRALKIDENNTIYWRKYAEINLQLNFFEAATNAYYKCLALKDENLAIFLGLSDALVFLGEFNDALKVLFLAYKKHKDIMEIVSS